MTKALLEFLVDAYAHHRAPLLFPDAPPIGKGIGLAFGLFAMQRTWADIELIEVC
jgi:ATP-binding cassette subfamily C (CFTR/MRP) protein 1